MGMGWLIRLFLQLAAVTTNHVRSLMPRCPSNGLVFSLAKGLLGVVNEICRQVDGVWWPFASSHLRRGMERSDKKQVTDCCADGFLEYVQG